MWCSLWPCMGCFRVDATRLAPRSLSKQFSARGGSSYDLVIVGCGMVGSAAARHASKARFRVALVGPSEPTDDGRAGREIFGAHYDEGRITRKTDPDPVWATLAARSIERYHEIAIESGVEFFSEVGHLAVSFAGSENLACRLENAKGQGVSVEELDDIMLQQRFPYMCFPAGSAGIFEADGSGYISARGLVKAQTLASARLGCTVVVDEVVAVEQHQSGHFLVRLGTGSCMEAERVLVAAGAFCNSRPLLPAGVGNEAVQLDTTLFTAQTVHFILNERDSARLAGMPSIIYKGAEWWAYILPPIKYPDGTTRLKLGGGRFNASDLLSGKRKLELDDVADWYRSRGCSASQADMESMVRELIPDLEPLEVCSDSCVTCHTPTGQAYIGVLRPGLAVATGGNGYAAKSSDEIGRLAAASVLSHAGWGVDEPLDRSVFVPRLRGAVDNRELDS